MAGGLGATASTLPVDQLVAWCGWRGAFAVLGGAVLLVAASVLIAAPVGPSRSDENWRDNLAGILVVYRTPVFWRFAPLSTSVIGTAFAVHGLWAARWMSDVGRLSDRSVVMDMLAMGAGLTLGAGFIGIAADRLRGVMTAQALFGIGCALFIGVQCLVLTRSALPAWLLWGAFASFGGMTALSYAITAETFPSHMTGRANAGLNVLHITMAFVLQAGMGLVASLWPADAARHLPGAAYTAAFSLPLALQCAALLWFALANIRWAVRREA